MIYFEIRRKIVNLLHLNGPLDMDHIVSHFVEIGEDRKEISRGLASAVSTGCVHFDPSTKLYSAVV